MDNVSDQSNKPEKLSQPDALLNDAALFSTPGIEPAFSLKQAEGIYSVVSPITKGIVNKAVGTPSNALETASTSAKSYLAWEIPVAIVGEAAAGTIALGIGLGYGLNKSLKFTAEVLHQGAKMLVTGHGGEIPGAVKNYYEQKKNALTGKITPVLGAIATEYNSAYRNSKPDDPALQQANGACLYRS